MCTNKPCQPKASNRCKYLVSKFSLFLTLYDVMLKGSNVRLTLSIIVKSRLTSISACVTSDVTYSIISLLSLNLSLSLSPFLTCTTVVLCLSKDRYVYVAYCSSWNQPEFSTTFQQMLEGFQTDTGNVPTFHDHSSFSNNIKRTFRCLFIFTCLIYAFMFLSRRRESIKTL